MYTCKYCGKQFEKVQSCSAHIAYCRLSPNYKENIRRKSIRMKGISTVTQKMIDSHPEKYIKKEFKIICPKCGNGFIITCTENDFKKGKYRHYCSRKCANSHVVSIETKVKIGNSVRNSEKFKKSILKTTKIQYCKYCEKEYKDKHSQFCSKECKALYLKNVLSKCGGFREHSVKNYKSGWYKGIHCDSSWELVFLIYHFDHNISISRCKEVRKYIDVNGIERKFYPDFVVNGQIIEIKGKQDINYINKQNYNKDVTFLFKSDMQFYINYVVNKYGSDYIRMYDTKDKNPI